MDRGRLKRRALAVHISSSGPVVKQVDSATAVSNPDYATVFILTACSSDLTNRLGDELRKQAELVDYHWRHEAFASASTTVSILLVNSQTGNTPQWPFRQQYYQTPAG